MAPDLVKPIIEYSYRTQFLAYKAELMLVSPIVNVGGALLEATLVIPWWVRLPPLVAKDGSANLLWLIVGISGAAKCPASQIDWSLYENRLMFPDELRWRRGVRDMSNILTPHTPASG